ncbi:transposase [Saccharicrinis sp. FJH62]|uniref:transposase n=1 Tax=Saccharicrinis sp. FJH62 TaxID=3344657 RepID=UPI0035D4DC47
MDFESDQLYHVYNQGNNKQDIFFCKENYLFFLKKIETHISPYADIIAYCLMPNHFHLMIKVNSGSGGFALSEALAKTNKRT